MQKKQNKIINQQINRTYTQKMLGCLNPNLGKIWTSQCDHTSVQLMAVMHNDCKPPNKIYRRRRRRTVYVV